MSGYRTPAWRPSGFIAPDWKLSLMLLGAWMIGGVMVAGILPGKSNPNRRTASRALHPPATVLRDAGRAAPLQPSRLTPTQPPYLYFPLTLRTHADPPPTPAAVTTASLKFYKIDFEDQRERVSIRIQPAGAEVNRGNPISIEFYPGSHCAFGDGYACANVYLAGNGEQVTFLTVHSGIGGEGEPFRRAVEGAWINQALYPLPQVQANLEALTGAKVSLSQGGKSQDGFRLAALVRVPAEGVGAYFRSPVSAALRLAARSNPGLKSYLEPNQPLLVFETCGWKMPGEPWADGVTSTSGSVYLGVIVEGKK